MTTPIDCDKVGVLITECPEKHYKGSTKKYIQKHYS